MISKITCERVDKLRKFLFSESGGPTTVIYLDDTAVDMLRSLIGERMNKSDQELLEGFEEFASEMRAGTAKRRDPWVIETILISKIKPYVPVVRRASLELRPLLKSIRKRGIERPILVRPTPKGFKLMDGNRRVEACKKLEIKKIPAMVMNDKNWAYNRAFDLWEGRA
jgi:hypothetical protein